MGLYGLYSKDNRTDRERYLEDELEREREARLERDRRDDEAREKLRKEHQEQWRSSYRQADSWPEAFQKQANLTWREHNQYPPDPDDVDRFFEQTALANEKALEIWHQVSTSKQAKLEELQKQIDAVWDAVRNEVADELIKSSDRKEYLYVASAIRDDELAGYLDW